jgi:hypothetical protein
MSTATSESNICVPTAGQRGQKTFPFILEDANLTPPVSPVSGGSLPAWLSAAKLLTRMSQRHINLFDKVAWISCQ